MKKATILLTVLITGFMFEGPRFTLVRSIPGSASFMTTDHLGNVYLVKGDILEKYNSEGNLLKSFSNKVLGSPTFVDTHDPLKILLYYRSFQQVVLMDNTLSGSGNPVPLDALGYNQARLVCHSHDNGLWIYNPPQSELVRFNQNLQKTQQTGNIAQITGLSIDPNFLIEQNNMLFLNDSSTGILVFDVYGNYSKAIPLKGLSSFQISNDRIQYLKEGKLKSYDLRTLEEQELSLPAADVLGVRTEKEKLYLLKQKSLEIYSITQ